jgi:hypothetical protein
MVYISLGKPGHSRKMKTTVSKNQKIHISAESWYFFTAVAAQPCRSVKASVSPVYWFAEKKVIKNMHMCWCLSKRKREETWSCDRTLVQPCRCKNGHLVTVNALIPTEQLLALLHEVATMHSSWTFTTPSRPASLLQSVLWRTTIVIWNRKILLLMPKFPNE